MKKILILALFSCIMLAQPAHEESVQMPSDILLDEELPLEHTQTDCFEEIDINGSCIITLVQGESCGFYTEGEYLEIEVKRNTIYIETDAGYRGRTRQKAFLYITDLKQIKIQGAAHLYNVKKLELADIELQINGSGQIRLIGMAENVDIEIDGSGNALLKDLPAKTYDIEINGSGKSSVNVSDSLEVEINGSGNVHYTGNPDNIDQQINGSGNVLEMRMGIQ